MPYVAILAQALAAAHSKRHCVAMLGLYGAAGCSAGAPPPAGAPSAGMPQSINALLEQDQRLDSATRQTLQEFFAHVQIDSLTDLAELSSLAPLDAYLRTQLERYEAQSGPVNPSVRSTVGRVIKAALDYKHQPLEPAPASGAPADARTRDLLAGMLADKGETDSLQRLLTARKVNVRQLIDAAAYGEPAPKTLTSDEDLKKIGGAAELGYAMPLYVCAFPDPSKTNEYIFPHMVAALGRFAHGGLLQWRHDPATAINMFTEAAGIASDRNLGSATRAARFAAEYLEKCREQLFAWSRSHPQNNSAANDALSAQVSKQYTCRDTQCYQDALQAVDANLSHDRPKAGSQQHQPQQRPNSRSDHCLSYALGRCSNRNCKFAHVCAFCGGATRGCPGDGYLEWHLEHLRRPKIIVPKSGASGSGGQERRNDVRSRSRSPRGRGVKEEEDDYERPRGRKKMG